MAAPPPGDSARAEEHMGVESVNGTTPHVSDNEGAAPDVPAGTEEAKRPPAPPLDGVPETTSEGTPSPAKADASANSHPLTPGVSQESSRKKSNLWEESDEDEEEEAFIDKIDLSHWDCDEDTAHPTTCLVLGHGNSIRRAAAALNDSDVFQGFIMLCIFVNSILLAVDQPAYDEPASLLQFLQVMEYVFTGIFITEMLIKITAMGFIVHKTAYLRSGWNRLDFLIVIGSIVVLIFDGGNTNVSAVRVIRVLRPLRSVSRIKNLKLLIAGLFQALPQVVDNFFLFIFIILVFGIAGVQLWAGRLSDRCYITEFPPWADNTTGNYTNLTVPHLQRDDDLNCGGTHQCVSPPNMTSHCERHVDIYRVTNLNYDNFLTSSLLTMKVMTLENWPDDLDQAMNFAGGSAALFFISLTLIGGFFCVNLFLAVLTEGYANAHAAMDGSCDAEIQCEIETDPDAPANSTVSVPDDGSATTAAGGAAAAGGLLAIGPRRKSLAGDTLTDPSAKNSTMKSPRSTAQILAGSDDGAEDVPDKHGQEDGIPPWDKPPFLDDRAVWRRFLGWLVRHPWFEGTVMLVTATSVIALAIDHHGMSQKLNSDLDTVGYVCLGVFTLEILAKFIAYNPVAVLQHSSFNVLDCFLVIIDYLVIILSAAHVNGAQNLGALRAFRVLRVFRMLARVDAFAVVLAGILHSVYSIGWLAMLILLFLYIFAVLGMQLFGGTYGNDVPLADPHDSFGTVWRSAVLSFVVMTGDSWTDKMRVGMNSVGLGAEIVPVLYFMGLYIIGNYILVNLSVAIIVDKLAEKMEMLEEAIRESEKDELQPPMLLLPRVFATKEKGIFGDNLVQAQEDPGEALRFFRRNDSVPGFLDVLAPRTHEDVLQTDTDLANSMRPAAAVVAAPYAARSELMLRTSNKNQILESGRIVDTAQMIASDDHHDHEYNSSMSATQKKSKKMFVSDLTQLHSDCSSIVKRLWLVVLSWFRSTPVIAIDSSLFCLSPTNPLRRLCMYLVGTPFFNAVLLACISANVIFLAFDRPGLDDTARAVFQISDIVFAVVFAVELVIKVVAFGAIYPTTDQLPVIRRHGCLVEPAYLRDPWNCVDAFVVVVSIVGLFVPSVKVLRSLRTLRLIVRVESTRVILLALFEAIPHVLHGIFLALVVFLVFGILGVQLFKGRFYYCNDLSISERALCNGTYITEEIGPVFPTPVEVPRVWTRTVEHFDHIGASMLALFKVMVGDGWSEVMFLGMDSVDEDHALRLNANEWYSLYFIVVYITGNFFALNMMIGILINYFSKKKQMHDGSALLTPQQRMYVKAQYAIGETADEDEARPLMNDTSQLIYHIITMKRRKLSRHQSVFDVIMFVFIAINVLAVAMEFDGMGSDYGRALDIIQLVCLIIFTIEMLIKLAAYGHRYFTAAWNVFDFTIVVIGWVAVGLPLVKFLSFLRVLRIVKLIRGSGVEKLVKTLLRSLMSLFNVAMILMFTYFVFAVAGVQLFGTVRRNGTLNHNRNFENVPNAMLLLYQAATTEGWDSYMRAVSISPPDCVEGKDCGNEAAAVIYFLLYITCSSFIALQLFVAVIVEIFSADAANDPGRMAFLVMKERWRDAFGEDARSVHVDDFIKFIPQIPQILSDIENPSRPKGAEVFRFLAGAPIPVDAKLHVWYRDVVSGIAYRKYHVDLRTMGGMLGDAMNTLFIGTAFSVAEVLASQFIGDAWKRMKHNVAKRKESNLAEKHRNAW